MKKTPANTQPTTRLFVRVESSCLHSKHSEKEFGGWEEAHDAQITAVDKHVALGEASGSRGEWVNVQGKVNDGDTVYVLFMLYEQGDSFGRSSGNHEVFWVFTDLDKGKAALEVVKSANEYRYNEMTDRSTDVFTLEFELEDGTKVKVSNPAAGYFERMEDVYLKRMVVGANQIFR